MKLYTYQEQFINDVKEGKSVVCNWARGGGKTLAVVKMLLDVRPEKITYSSYDGLRLLKEKIKELLELDGRYDELIKRIYSSEDRITIEFHSGEVVRILSESQRGLPETEYTIYEDKIPRDIDKDKNKYIIMMTKNNYNKELQKRFSNVIETDVYDLINCGLYDHDFLRENSSSKYFYYEWAIKSKTPEGNKVSVLDFKDQALQRLMRQFLDTADTKDTVLTRKNIIEMMKDLKEIN